MRPSLCAPSNLMRRNSMFKKNKRQPQKQQINMAVLKVSNTVNSS